MFDPSSVYRFKLNGPGSWRGVRWLWKRRRFVVESVLFLVCALWMLGILPTDFEIPWWGYVVGYAVGIFITVRYGRFLHQCDIDIAEMRKDPSQ